MQLWSRLIGAMLLVTALSWASQAAADGRRVALVIGNANYQSLPVLANPGNDVENVAATLRASGFDVVVGSDVKRVELEKTVERFFRSLGNSDVSLFYYSGHGVQIAGKNYIIPIDASLKSAYDIETQTINLDTILEFMRANTKMQLVFLDACRNNPFGTKAYWVADKLEQVQQASVGLAGVKPSVGTLIAFATEPGSVSYDGGASQMSPFTSAFVKRALTPNDEIRSMLSRVRRDVVDATGGKQVPWESSSLVDDFFMLPQRPPPRIASMTKVDVQAGKSRALGLPQPAVDGSSKLSVTFDLLPEAGRLDVGGQPVTAGKAYDASILQDAVYTAPDGRVGSTNVAAFTVSDELGQASHGLVAIAVTDDQAVTADNGRAAWTLAVAQTSDALSKASLSLPIGVGPVPVPLAPAMMVASRDTTAPLPQLKVAEMPQTGVLQIGDRKIVSGAVMDAASMADLRYEPQVGAENKPQVLKLEVMASADVAPKFVDVTVTPVIDRCDMLAGEPLDPQGVTSGVLPNEIKLPEALEACREAVSQHKTIPRFAYEYARAQLASRDVKGASVTMAEAARRGHIRATYGIGTLNSLGIGRAANLTDANRDFRKSAEQGDPYGMLSYGRNLFYGRGVPVDKPAGLKLMIKSAELGHTYAMNELGAIFVEGRGVPSDPPRGVEYYRQGAVRNDIYSFNNLGLAFMRGQGVGQDDQAAFAMFTKAADGGHPGAPANLGFLYLNGRSVEKDPVKAKAMFESAADKGDWYGALLRGDVAMASGDAADAARYYAMAVAFDRFERSTEARGKLADLPRDAKQSALATALAGVPAKKAAGSLDARLEDAVLKDWQRKNPRMDLF